MDQNKSHPEGAWERDSVHAFGPGSEFKPRPVLVEFVDGGGTFKILITKELFDRLRQESTRMKLEFERKQAEEKRREQARQQEELRRKEWEAQTNRTFETIFGMNGPDLEDLIKNIFGASQAFRDFTPPTFSGTSSSGTYSHTFSGHTTFKEEQEAPPPKPEKPKVWTQDGMMRRLCELARVEYPSELQLKSLVRRAQRYCHPDSEGSHALWLELDELKRLLRI